jgi:hypothetical protein
MEISKSRSQVSGEATRLSGLERALMVLPLLGGAFFGLLPLLVPVQFASATGYPGNDVYIYRLAGCATFGYAVGLTFALLQDRWEQLHMLVIAVFTFNLASIYACLVEIFGGSAQPVIYLILPTSILFVALTATLLYIHRDVPPQAPNVANRTIYTLVAAVVLAGIFGLLPLFIPSQFGQLFGFKATDLFIFRQAGAATLGYSVMGIFEIRSRRWEALRWPLVMALVFNALGCLVSLSAIFLEGNPSWVAYPIALASGAVTIGAIFVLIHKGR